MLGDEQLLRLGWGVAVLATVVVLTLAQAPLAVIMAVLVALPNSLGSGSGRHRRGPTRPGRRRTGGSRRQDSRE